MAGQYPGTLELKGPRESKKKKKERKTTEHFKVPDGPPSNYHLGVSKKKKKNDHTEGPSEIIGYEHTLFGNMK